MRAYWDFFAKFGDAPNGLSKMLCQENQYADFNLSEGCFPIFLRIFYKCIQILYDFYQILIKFDIKLL